MPAPENTQAPTSSDGLLNAGQLLADRYRVVRAIGAGGFGVVYEVEHVDIGKRFALKVLTQRVGNRAVLIERFRREAVTTSRLAHPNIVSVTDFGTTRAGQVFFVMELLEGRTAAELLEREKRLTLSRAIPILAATAHALLAAHRAGVVHRDLKPANIFLIRQEDIQRGTQRDVVKILDFGLAKVMQEEPGAQRLSVEGVAFGTPGYMAPEQVQGVDVDHRADIYALGCIAFEIVSGTPVYSGTPIEVLMAHCQKPLPSARRRCPEARIPDKLESLIERCLQKDASLRYASCQQVLDELRKLAEQLLTPDGRTRVELFGAGGGGRSGAAAALSASDTAEPQWWESFSSSGQQVDAPWASDASSARGISGGLLATGDRRQSRVENVPRAPTRPAPTRPADGADDETTIRVEFAGPAAALLGDSGGNAGAQAAAGPPADFGGVGGAGWEDTPERGTGSEMEQRPAAADGGRPQPDLIETKPSALGPTSQVALPPPVPQEVAACANGGAPAEAARRIVLVESDAALGAQLERELGQRGYAMTTVLETNRAIPVISEIRPTVVILAVELTQGSGYAICSRLKQDLELQRIPVLLTSSKATRDVFEQHRHLPTRADDYLIKPFTLHELLARLDGLVPAAGSRSMAAQESDSAPSRKEPPPAIAAAGSRAARSRPVLPLLLLVSGVALLAAGLVGFVWPFVRELLRRPATEQRSQASANHAENAGRAQDADDANNGALVISITPEDATLMLGNRLLAGRGGTRVANDLRPGQLLLEAQHASCESERRELSVQAGRATVVRIELRCPAAARDERSNAGRQAAAKAAPSGEAGAVPSDKPAPRNKASPASAAQ